jgi:hypothetical protein
MKKMPGFEHAQTGKGIAAAALPLIPNLEKKRHIFLMEHIFKILLLYNTYEYPYSVAYQISAS